jgi:dTDP-4-amino-4,6-dideoxygalactose transaminase
MFRDHGQSRKYHHAALGWNARMDGFQGAILNTKLKYLPSWIEARRKNASIYNKSFLKINRIIQSTEASYAKHVYHVYTVRVQHRDRLIRKLAEKDIHCAIHYPVPVHLQDAYLNLGFTNSHLEISERVASEILSLPMYPELNESQIEYVIQAIKELMADA